MRKTPCSNLGFTRLPLFAAAVALTLAAGPGSLQAQPITVGNSSFESQVVNPLVFPVDFRLDNWQKAPQPGYFTNSAQLTWDQTVGLFNGTPAFSPAPYSNLNGNQATYMLSLPQAGLFQDNQSIDWNGTVGGLNATYQVGLAYQLTVGVFGKQMVENFSSMQLSLYYRSGANMITVGLPTIITFTTNTFNPAGPFTLIDYSVTTPIVQPGDAWVGQNIGIRIDSLLGDGNGYWDLDNARLAAVPEPGTLSLLAIGCGGLLFAVARSRRQT